MSTIIITLLLAGTVILIIRKMIKDKKEGKGCCSGGCQGCPHGSGCEQTK